MRIRFAALFACALAFSGCTDPDDDDGRGHQHMAMDSYMVHAHDMPTGAMQGGEQFTMTTMVEGDDMHTSDHIGAHMWMAPQTDPTANLTQAMTPGCAHQGGEMPGEYTITCTAPEESGTYYMRAHARGMEDGETFHWWGSEETITVE